MKDKIRVIVDENLKPVRFEVSSQTLASKTLSWYAAEAPNELESLIKILYVRRFR